MTPERLGGMVPAHRPAPPPVRRERPRPSLGTRLHALWASVWASLWTALMAPGVIVHSALRPGTRTFKCWAGTWARILLAGIGIRMQTEMRADLDSEQPVVFVANHQNALDILTVAAGIPHPFGFTAKAALRTAPFIGAVLKHTACIFVDRSTPRRAVQSLAEAGEQIRGGHSVLVFCEGERTWQTPLHPFLRGGFLLALEAGVPLVPVVIDGDVGLLDERVWASRPGWVRLVVGEAISTEGLTRKDAPELMARVRSWMERELGLQDSTEA